MDRELREKYELFVEADGTKKVLSSTGLRLVASVLPACDTDSTLHPLAQFQPHSTYKKLSSCKCGQIGCYHMARIENILTHQVVDSIGSTCIETQFDYNNIREWIRSERHNDAKAWRDAVKKEMVEYGERMYNGKTLNEFVRFEKKVRRQIPQYPTKMETLLKTIKDDELKRYFKYSLKHKV